MTWERACTLAELRGGQMRGVMLGAERVLRVNLAGEVRAYVDRCCHKGMPLSAGRLEGDVITCAVHEWQYDANTGAGLNPANVTLRRFPVEVRDGAIWVDV